MDTSFDSSGIYKALLYGNNATTVGTVYQNLAGETIATATTTNLVASAADPSTLTNPIGKTHSGLQSGLVLTEHQLGF